MHSADMAVNAFPFGSYYSIQVLSSPWLKNPANGLACTVASNNYVTFSFMFPTRFGSHVSGAPPVERVLRVNNTSPCG